MSYSADSGFQTIRRPGLQRIRLLLEALGNPQNGLAVVHVAGTNGKGSVCAFLQSILTRAGYRTGVFSSPHLVYETERIAVDGIPVDQTKLESLLDEVAQAAEQTAQKLGERCTLFERYTAAALLHFSRVGTDVAILEAGLGGRLDTTNVIETPVLSVITRIAMDHQTYLGNTLPEIAEEKAGIIKPGGQTVCLTQREDVNAVFRARCHAAGNTAHFTGQPVLKGWHNYREVFDYGEEKDLVCGLCGKHQIENACVALEAVNVLRHIGYTIPDTAMRAGLAGAVHHARFEFLREQPPFLFDGAHNPNGMAALKESFMRYFPDSRYGVVLGVMRDKPVDEMLRILGDDKAVFYPVEIPNETRSLPADALAERIAAMGLACRRTGSVQEAVRAAQTEMPLAVACGSLYLYEYVLYSL